MKVKSVAFAGQALSGKTFTLASILYNHKRIPKPETKYLDFEPDEQERGSTTTVKVFSLNDGETRIYFVDTPGFIEFIPQSEMAIRMCDFVFIFIRGGTDTDASVERIFITSRKHGIPSAFVITQYSSSDWKRSLESLQLL